MTTQDYALSIAFVVVSLATVVLNILIAIQHGTAREVTRRYLRRYYSVPGEPAAPATAITTYRLGARL